jgi:hypothetical protein
MDFFLRGGREGFRHTSGPDVKHSLCAILLRHRHIEIQARIFEDVVVLSGARHADDLEPLRLIGLHVKAFADRILAGPEARRHHFVDDGNRTRALVVGRRECAAARDRNL